MTTCHNKTLFVNYECNKCNRKNSFHPKGTVKGKLK